MVTVRYNKPLGYDLKDNPREIKDSELSRYLDCGWTLIKKNRDETPCPVIMLGEVSITHEEIKEIKTEINRKRGRPHKWK